MKTTRGRVVRRLGASILCLLSAGWAAGCSYQTPLTGVHKIKHVIVLMQENRSFDSYFGTFPGADGIPMANGVPSVCSPDPYTKQCVAPYVDHSDINGGGPHDAQDAIGDVNGGLMNGYLATVRYSFVGVCGFADPHCVSFASKPDVMGYHTASDLPNYWTYAKDFVLQDHMFEPNASWSLPAHLFEVSEWSAHCTEHNNPGSCTPTPGQPLPGRVVRAGAHPAPPSTPGPTSPTCCTRAR